MTEQAKAGPATPAAGNEKLKTTPTATPEKDGVKVPSLRERIEEMMKDGKVTSEELRSIANELDKTRNETAMEIKNLKAVVSDFGLRILEEYTVKDKGEMEKLELLLKALKKADILKDDITIEALPADGKPLKLRLDTKEKKMRSQTAMEGWSTSEDETSVAFLDKIRVHFANSVPNTKDETLVKIDELIANLRETDSNGNDRDQVRVVNSLLEQAFEKNPLPANIRISRTSDVSKLISFLEEFKGRKVVGEEAKPSDKPAAADKKGDKPANAADKTTNAAEKPGVKPISAAVEGKESEKGISKFINALANSTAEQRIERHVSRHAKKEIEKALMNAKIDDATKQVLQMPIGTLETNRAFQDAIGMKKPNDGYIGDITINALMAKVGSKYRLSANAVPAPVAKSSKPADTQEPKAPSTPAPTAESKKPVEWLTDAKTVEAFVKSGKKGDIIKTEDNGNPVQFQVGPDSNGKLIYQYSTAVRWESVTQNSVNQFAKDSGAQKIAQAILAAHPPKVAAAPFTPIPMPPVAPFNPKAPFGAPQVAKAPEAANIAAEWKKYYMERKRDLDQSLLSMAEGDDKALMTQMVTRLQTQQGDEFINSVKTLETSIGRIPTTGKFDNELVLAIAKFTATH